MLRLHAIAMVAKTLASVRMSGIRQYSLGWCAVSGDVHHTAAGSPALRKNAATVPPPMPMGFASLPVTKWIALERAFTTGASEGVGGAASSL